MSLNKKEGAAPVYDNSLKIAVAREHQTGNLGYGRLAAKYGLPNAATVRYFVRWYKTRYPSLQATPAVKANEVTGDETALLRKQLREANLKVAGFEIMMEIAQKELGIDIAKKYGTKQSSK
jgi:transposase-like protein